MNTLSSIVKGSGPGLLLCHGGGGSVQSNFGPLLGPLSEHFTVVAPDYPGSGATPRATSPLVLDELVDECVIAAIDAGVTRFSILAYSTGCAVAIRAAIRFPTIVTSIILTHGFAKLDAASQMRAYMLWDLAAKGEWEMLAGFLVHSMISEKYLDTLSEEIRKQLIRASMRAIPPGFCEQIDLTRRIDVSDDLRCITVPTLVIHAKREHFILPSTGESLNKIPKAIVTELDCGHFPIDCVQEWLSLIQEFLTKYQDDVPPVSMVP